LAELLPYARFVHIIRNPIDYVKSESSRNRYGVGDNLDIRIPVMGNSIIEKNAYAYLAINDKITKLLAEIPDSRKQFIKFEEIFNDESKIGSLTHWCGIRYREKHWNNLRNHRINESGKARTFNLDNIEKVIEITQKYYNLFQ
ncbi:MAG TPA: hypothetical protein VE912_00135, partial [Bacteroidales bacterium]|nr:hypothetical protein [Bacteroidales bacterium]